jgi:hypothetical protein
MFDFASIDLKRIATAAVGALILSTACVTMAVAPGHGVTADAPLAAVEARNQA